VSQTYLDPWIMLAVMKTSNKYDATIKMLGIVTATLLLIPIVAQTQSQIATAQSTPENDTALRVAKNKQYLAEAGTAYEQVDLHLAKVEEYKKQKENAKSEQEKQDLDKKIQASLAEIGRLEKRIDELQQLNWKLYEMEPELKERLLSAKEVLFDKYENPDSSTYVGDNAVEWVTADHLRRNILLLINPDKEASGFAVPTETSVNGIPVVKEYGKTQLLACVNNDNKAKCDPLVGGISIADKARVPDLNTLGYKATRGTTVGFVMAGHSTNGVNSQIVQPHNDANRIVGTVQVHCNSNPNCSGDMAFVATSVNIVNQIWRGTGTFFNVVAKTDCANQQLGTLVRKVGAATGQSLADITDKNLNCSSVTAKMRIATELATGDSGSPVFTGTDNVNLYGMIWGMSQSADKTQTWARYHPQNYIQQQIGAIPSLTG